MNQQLRLSKLIGLTLLVLSIFCSACKKKEIQGPKGDPGTTGGGGNANISTSEIFTIASSQWGANADSSGWQHTISSSLITQNIVDKGAVKVFELRGTSWWELPLTNGDLFTQFGFQAGSVTLLFADIHGGLPAKPATTSYRIVVLSAAKQSTSYTKIDDHTLGEIVNHKTN
jgi:hypothetical protein